MDDFFEHTLSRKDETKITGNPISPMEMFSQFKAIFYNPTDPDLPSLQTNATNSVLQRVLLAWKSVVQSLEKINPAYKEFTQFIIELENYFTYMLGSFEHPINSTHSEYMYRIGR